MHSLSGRGYAALVGSVFLIPAAHPLLVPLVGVPSHLLWFAHVLPVALLSYRFGRRAALVALVTSALLVVAGERLFGGGYGTPADWRTALSLAVAVFSGGALMASFALYARRVAARYRLLFQEVTLGVLRTDEKGTIWNANPAACEIFDTDRETLRGRTVRDVLLSPELRDLEHICRTGPWTGRVDVELHGERRHLEVILVVVPLPEGLGYQVLISDQSVPILQERELQRQSKLATLGEALAGVAHELNNPLTAILGHVQLGLAEGAPSEDRDEILQIVEEQARRMKGLVAELLGFSRSDDEEQETEVHTLLRRIMRLQELALSRNVKLRDQVEWRGTVCASPDKVEQIVLNLVSNAADALKDGGGGTITVVCRARSPWLEIEVQDDGPGVPEELLDRVFQPFVTSKPVGEGTGLGLAVSRRLARSMGGDLSVLNLPDSGACFTLHLPLSTCEEEDPPPGRHQAVTAGVLEKAGAPE